MKTKVAIAVSGLCLAIGGSLYAEVPLNYSVENRGTSCEKITPATKTNTKLPDPFAWQDGSGRIKTDADWICRRNEIKADLEKFEIGPKPDKPADLKATYSGGSLSTTVTVGGNTLTLTSKVTVPSGTGPFPVVIGMGSGAGSVGTFTGAIQVTYDYGKVYTLDYNGKRSQSDGFFKVYPDLYMKVGGYSAWSWGLSRVIDGLELIKDDIKADLSRIAISGCSAAGKMALFAGALDERVTLTIAQESGGGGIPAWRVSNKLGTSGYSCEKIDNTNYTWFIDAMKTQNPNDLPYDHHELIAMIAPRAFIALGNQDYNTWLCDQGGIISCQAAHEVWKAMGVGDRFGYDFTGGHQHCSPASSQTKSTNAFIDKFINKKTETNTSSVLIEPPSLKENIANWKDWDTPTIDFSTAVSPDRLRIPQALSGVRCFFAPSASRLTIESSGSVSYSIMNQMGQILEKGSTAGTVTTAKTYSNGLYFVRINQGENSGVFRVLQSR